MSQTNIERLLSSETSMLHTEDNEYNPFSWYKRMRETSPVYLDPHQEIWNVFLYDDVKRVISDKDYFSSKRDDPQLLSRTVLSADPPDHTRLRSLVNKAFTPRMVADWEPRIQAIADDLLEQVSGQPMIELVEHFSSPLPVMVIAELLGIPSSDRKQFKEWSNSIVIESSSQEELSYAINKRNRAISELLEYFDSVIEEKRKDLKEDIISVLIQATENEGKLVKEELLAFCIILLVAGNETTTNLISNAVYTFMENKTIWEKVKQNADLVPNVIEEVLRYRSPVRALTRKVKAETTIGGHVLKPNHTVIAWIGSANRDEKKFSHSEDFDFSRDPNPHLAFGNGIHFCLGAPLARLEAKIALTRLINSYSDISFQEGYKIDPIRSPFIYGLKSLPILVN